MINQNAFLQNIIQALNKTNIPYMVSGSIASSFHGYPRATNDADIVIAPTEKQLKDFVECLGKNYYVSLDAAIDGLKKNFMFNVIDTQSGWKADLIILKERAYSKTEFQRRRNIRIKQLDVSIVSPEDAILTKLEWAKQSGSEQQFRDAAGIAVVQRECLDKEYLYKWANELQITSSLELLLQQAKAIINKGNT
ncbi:MAG: hypothetical protein ACYTBV_04995 [Planctomycetota bacterium]|jgi:hypothetical protein